MKYLMIFLLLDRDLSIYKGDQVVLTETENEIKIEIRHLTIFY